MLVTSCDTAQTKPKSIHDRICEIDNRLSILDLLLRLHIIETPSWDEAEKVGCSGGGSFGRSYFTFGPLDQNRHGCDYLTFNYASDPAYNIRSEPGIDHIEVDIGNVTYSYEFDSTVSRYVLKSETTGIDQ